MESTAVSVGQRVRLVGNATHSLVETICESRVNYWAGYATDFSCPCIFAYLGLRYAFSWPALIFGTLLGLIVFSLIEYAVHRWLLHDLRSPLFYLHNAHHNDPEKTSAFLFPTSFLLLMPVWFLFAWGFHFPQASFFLLGLSGGYFYFDTLHHVAHTRWTNQFPFRLVRKRWAFHKVHHRIEHSNFGVSTSLWDHVFGTHQNQMKRKQS